MMEFRLFEIMILDIEDVSRDGASYKRGGRGKEMLHGRVTAAHSYVITCCEQAFHLDGGCK